MTTIPQLPDIATGGGVQNAGLVPLSQGGTTYKASISQVEANISAQIGPALNDIQSLPLASSVSPGDLLPVSQAGTPRASTPTLIAHAALGSSLRLYVAPTGNDANPGTSPALPKRSIKAAVESATPGTTVFVESGNYVENNPVNFPDRVSLVGDNLRRVDVRPSNPTLDIFHVRSGCYVTGVTFRDHKSPSFACAFPCALARATVNVGGQITGLNLSYSPTGYGSAPSVWVEPPFGGGTQATATATISSGSITGLTVTNGGSGYDPEDPPWVSISHPTPASIVSSPYIQNCSSITGPFDTAGNPFTIAQLTPPFDVQNVAGTGRAINPRGAGGGIRIDGQVVATGSPLNSFVADAFTQINQGGAGHLLLNKGYAQFVSCFTTFSHTGYEARAGAFANVSNSVLDFGLYGLRARGYYPIAQVSGTVATQIRSTVVSVTMNDNGLGYTSAPTVTFTGGGGTGAAATAAIDGGVVVGINVTNPGSGYTSAPTVTFTGGGGTGAAATANMISTGSVVLNGVSRRPDVGTTVAKIGSTFYTITGATPLAGGSTTLSVYPSVPTANVGDVVGVFDVSLITSGSLVTEYVGSGVTYNALPKFGGIPNPANSITTTSPGRIYYAVLTESGNFSIGPFFTVEQSTGAVTINSTQFNLAGLSSIGPFKRNGVAVGVQLMEVSNDAALIASTGTADGNTAPTQFAVKSYVDGRDLNDLADVYVPAPTSGQVLLWDNADQRWEAYTLTTSDIGEGTNLYHTTSRVRAAISATGSLSYDNATGVMSFTDAVTSVAGRTGAITLSAGDVSGLAAIATSGSGADITSGTVASARLPTFGTAEAGIAPASGGGATNFLRADGTWAAPAGSATGSVTSVAVSGGTTGLTTSGGPITSSGTITFGGTLAVASGGTGATDVATARTNLGLAIGTNVQAWDADLDAIGALAGTSGLLRKTAANTWSLETATYITGNQTITVSGDATGSGSTSIALTLANSGASAGTYRSVTVDVKGRITSGTNPTTLAGYGITDAAALGANTFTGEQNLADNLLTRPYIKDYAEVLTAPTISAGALTLNLETGNVFNVALNAAITTLTISNPPATGRAGSFTLVLTADGTARAVTWGAAVKWAGGTAPTLTSTTGKKDIIVMTTLDAGTSYFAVVAGQNF